MLKTSNGVKRSKKRKKFVAILAVVLAAIFVSSCIFISSIPPREPKVFGVTFSKSFAEKFGFDWKKAYEEIFNDLGIRDVRIPVYWSEVEPEKGRWNFDDIDWQLKKAREYNAKVILAIGRKLPRWPECHIPHWVRDITNSPAKGGGKSQFPKEELLGYIEKVVSKYKDNSTVWAWQVENEPFLPFGECPLLGKEILDEEIATVKKISSKPIIVTDSGEFGIWLPAAKRADIFGSTLYRHVYNEFFGYITYPLPPSFFRLKQGLLKLFLGQKPIIVTELQAEPWMTKMLYETSVEEQFAHFDTNRFKATLEYIKGTGFDTFYFWGAEWWWWLKQNGHPEMWNLAKETIQGVGAK